MAVKSIQRKRNISTAVLEIFCKKDLDNFQAHFIYDLYAQ